jgi:hypothetical protein
VCSRDLRRHQRLCDTCVRRLTDDLGDIVALVDDLDTMLTRQSRTSSAGNTGVTSRSSETPLFWDDRASKAQRRLHQALAGLAAMLELHHADPRPVELRRLSSWLLAGVGCLAHLDGFPAAADRAMAAVGRVRGVIDRRAEQQYVGPCYALLGPDVKCGGHLYVELGRTSVTCPKCHVEHEIEGRQQWLLDEMEDQLAHPALIARALSSLGQPVTDARIRGWVFRGRLMAKGVDSAGRQTYRMGDVLDLIAEDAERAEKLEERKRAEQEKRERKTA